MTCTKNLVPLNKVVSAAVVDTYEDWGKMRQSLSFWAVRGLKKLQVESLPNTGIRKILLTINPNTRTATLPLDFNYETFIGVIDSRGYKVPLKLNNALVDLQNISSPVAKESCPRCNQDTSICNDLVVTETVNLIELNGTPYEETVVKKLYPNGDYYLETTTPYWDINGAEVVYPAAPKREFIANLDIMPCGCLNNTACNIATLQTVAPSVYCDYYAPCDNSCSTSYGGYKVFPESGLIQFDARYRFEKVYLEYIGFLEKVQGQYMIPEVAFETLVEWTKFMSIDGKKNVSARDKQWRWQRYVAERGNMERVLGRISLSFLIQEIHSLPKFDIDYGYTCGDWYGCFGGSSLIATMHNCQVVCNNNGSTSGNGGGGSGGGGGQTINNTYITVNTSASFILAVKVDGNPGSPVAGQSTYQNNVLIGASSVYYSILAKQILTVGDNDFTFNSTTGTIDISPLVFVDTDTLILHYNKVAS